MAWQQRPYNELQYKALCEAGVSPLMACVIANRELPLWTKPDILQYVQCPLETLEDAAEVGHMGPLLDAFHNSPPAVAAIFGDYDVDGVMSTFLLYKFLLQCGTKIVVPYLPHRVEDGYGLNPKSVEHFLRDLDTAPDWIFVVDCGTSSRHEVQTLRMRFPEATVAILDHHQPETATKSTNADFLINPRFSKQYPLYCATGIVYQFIRGCLDMIEGASIYQYLPYAAVATVADVCELKGRNRLIVRNGLQAMGACSEVGMRELLNVAEIDPSDCTVGDVSYKIAPMINASGRMAIAKIAFNLLTSNSKAEAISLANQMRELNEERKRVQDQMIEECLKKLEAEPIRNSIVLFNPDWHSGIVGILAGKLAEKFRVPTWCFGKTNNAIKGSARSAEHIDIKAVMDGCSQIFLRYGGHEGAAGATLKSSELEQAPDVIDKAVAAYKAEHAVERPPLWYDAELSEVMLRKLDESFCERLEKLGPFGVGNQLPVFLVKGLKVNKVMDWKSGSGGFIITNTVRLDCCAREPNLSAKLSGKTIDALVTIRRNFKQGQKWMLQFEHCRKATCS